MDAQDFAKLLIQGDIHPNDFERVLNQLFTGTSQ
jgi:hypothetical protein